MIDPKTGPGRRVQVITSVQRRRRWSPEKKVRIVEEIYLPGSLVSEVAQRHGVNGNQVFGARRLMAQGALTAAGAGEEVDPTSQYRALETQVRELQRLLDKKTMENGTLKEAVSRAEPRKGGLARDLVAGGWSVTATAEALRLSRQHLSSTRSRPPPRPRGLPPLPDGELVTEIQALSPTCPPTGTGGCTRFCVAKPKPTAGRR